MDALKRFTRSAATDLRPVQLSLRRASGNRHPQTIRDTLMRVLSDMIKLSFTYSITQAYQIILLACQIGASS